MRRASTWLVIALLGAALAAVGWRVHRQLGAHTAGAGSRVFYLAESGHSLRFSVGGAAEVQVLCHPFAGAVPLHLGVAFLDASGGALERRALTLEAPRGERAIHGGDPIARGRLMRLVPPEGSSALELTTTDGRALVRVSRPSARRISRERALRRVGIDPAWLGAPGGPPLSAHRFVTLPAIGEAATVMLDAPEAPSPAAALPPEPRGERVAPHHAGVWNVAGPGTLTLRAEGAGRFEVETLSRSGARTDTLTAGGRLAVPIAAEPTTVIVRAPVGASGTLELGGAGTHGLDGGAVTRAERREWWTAADDPVRFALPDPRPVRVSCRRADPRRAAGCAWAFSDGHGRALREGVLAAPEGTDPFAAIPDGEVGPPDTAYLVPPPGAAALELRGAALVKVDALVEELADDRAAPPYDAPVAPLHWIGAPARAPRWVGVRPAGDGEERARRVALDLAPRLAARPAPPRPPVLSLLPSRAAARAEILEASQRAPGAATPLQPGVPVEVVVDERGAQARRLEARCQVDGELGGELVLRVDGQPGSRAPLSTSAVRLVALASPGPHRVLLDGRPGVRCTALAAAVGARRVQRTVFAGEGLQLAVKKPAGPFPVHFAVYSDRPAGELVVDVDGGRPARHSGRVEELTLATRRLRWDRAGTPQALLVKDHRPIGRVLTGTVILGDDLEAGLHGVAVRGASAWLRFWAPGRKPHREKAESYITTDEAP